MPARRWFVLALFFLLALAPRVGHAHRLPPEVIAFFRVDGARLHVVVRVPTAILLDARLPTVQTTMLDLSSMDEALKNVAAEVARSFDVRDGSQPLAPARTTWMLSLLTDRSFRSYESAVARLSGSPIPSDRAVYWNEAHVDIQYDYPLISAEPRVTARLNGLRLGGDFFQTRATYMPASGSPRTITVSGPPQRVSFEPAAVAAVTTLVRRGVDQLVNQRLLWWFVFCLALPIRRLADARRPFLAFAAAYVLAVGVVAARGAVVRDEVFFLAQFVAGAAVVLAAAQALITAGRVATMTVAVLFGLSAGVLLGSAVHELLPLAGSYGGLAVTVFALLVTIVTAALLVVLLSLVRAPYRLRAPEWLVTAALVALPAHEASHVIVDVAARLGERRPWDLQPLLAPLIGHWPIVALVVFLALMWVVSRTAKPLPAMRQDATS